MAVLYEAPACKANDQAKLTHSPPERSQWTTYKPQFTSTGRQIWVVLACQCLCNPGVFWGCHMYLNCGRLLFNLKSKRTQHFCFIPHTYRMCCNIVCAVYGKGNSYSAIKYLRLVGSRMNWLHVVAQKSVHCKILYMCLWVLTCVHLCNQTTVTEKS